MRLRTRAVVDHARGDRGGIRDRRAIADGIEVVLVAAVAVVLEVQFHRRIAREIANLETPRRRRQAKKLILNRRGGLWIRRDGGRSRREPADKS